MSDFPNNLLKHLKEISIGKIFIFLMITGWALKSFTVNLTETTIVKLILVGVFLEIFQLAQLNLTNEKLGISIFSGVIMSWAILVVSIIMLSLIIDFNSLLNLQ